jgi:hypothetical protein
MQVFGTADTLPAGLPAPITMTTKHLLVAAVLTAAGSLAAQDLLGVTWGGQTVRIHSYTGQTWPLGNALPGMNCLARANDGTYWSARRDPNTFQGQLLTIDPVTGVAAVVGSSPDLRALSAGPGTQLYGVRDFYSGDLLVRIDTTTAVPLIVGPMGFDGVQGLAMHDGVLYGWDTLAGLLVVNPLTGAAIDPFPAVGATPDGQSLCSHPDGRLLLGGGNNAGPDPLYVVDVATGTASLIATLPNVSDVRGIEPLGGFVISYGQGCQGMHGQVVLTVQGAPVPGGQVTTTSTNHAAGAVGVLVFGNDNQMFLGVPLPVSLDPMFGTVDCWLTTSIDGSIAMLATPTAPADMAFGFTVPLAASGALLHMQHVGLEPVPGGMSWSNAISLRVH